MKTNWQIITETENSLSNDCYKDCNSFCCSYKIILQNTRFMKNIATLHLTVDEYNYLLHAGRLQTGLDYRPLNIALLDDISFEIITAKCTFDGLCAEHKYRSFLCKLYPVNPLVNYKGEISSFEKGGIWQEKIFEKNPCTIDNDERLVNDKTLLIVEEFFKEPKNVFYYKCMDIVNRHIEEKICEIKNKNAGIEDSILIKEIELLYLKNIFIDFNKIKREATDLFYSMQSFWGDKFVLDN